jgi:hypothetical protein
VNVTGDVVGGVPDSFPAVLNVSHDGSGPEVTLKV